MTEPVEPTKGHPFGSEDLIKRPDLWAREANKWPIDSVFAAELDRYLHRVRPQNILEIGSGASTAIFARYAAGEELYGRTVRVTTLEHDARHAAGTEELLRSDGLGRYYADVQVRPLGRVIGSGGASFYVGSEIPDGVDFVLIDGPPEGLGGRAAVLPSIMPKLAPNAVVWLDDADRPGERKAVAEWLATYPELRAVILPFGKNGALELRRGEGDEPAYVDGSDVVLTILTGRRPALLAKQIDSLRAWAPGLLETAQVIVLHNDGGSGTDPLTRGQVELLRGSALETTSLYPIGRATSLLERAARQSGAAYWLHLEDDWRLSSAAPGWLAQAKSLLGTAKHPTEVAQVRLRHWSERTLPRHMVTRKPISWLAARGPESVPHLIASDAHLTFNPFLARVGALTGAFPCTGEADFQERGHALGLRRVAQMYPGAFTHLGEGELSLRNITKG